MDHLPNEIMIKILSYLPTIDLLQFIKAYEDYSNFLREKHVIQFLNFKNLFELSNIIDLCQFISTNVACNYIKVLNIGGLYWIPVQDIRKLISQLDMLEELYAIDTKLGAAMKDISLYGKLNILAISIEASQLDNMTSNIYFNSLNGLQKLCVKLYLKKDNFEEMYWLFGALKQLTELWIYDNDEQFGINYERIVAYLPNLYKLVIKSRRPVPVLDFSCWGLNKIYQSQRYNSAVETVFGVHSSKMQRTVHRFAPDYWDTTGENVHKEFILNKNSEEYKQIKHEVGVAVRNSNLSITAIRRIQDVHDYGQLLLREQLLAVARPHLYYYRVRRFVIIKKCYLALALQFNIDVRRCGLSILKLRKYIDNSLLPDESIIVVQAVTDDTDAEFIVPRNSGEYMIDYVVEV